MSRESARGSGSMMRESTRKSTSVVGAVMSALWHASAGGEGEADATGWETTWMGTAGAVGSFGWRGEDGCGCQGGDEEGE